MNILIVDVGGTQVKLFATSGLRSARFDSHSTLTPGQLMTHTHALTQDWSYEVVSIGIPGPVDRRGISGEPGNLGEGWVAFDFEQAFDRPVRVVNDAVMQALGAYHGGRMLFLGLGTGLGSTLVSEHVVVPLELGCLRMETGETMADVVGADGRERLGRQPWLEKVHQVIGVLKEATSADYVVLGGGNARHVDPLPTDTHRGGNEDAFDGGIRLWEDLVEPHDRPPAKGWRVVR
jgi:polyphosphate glucokinase